MSDPVPGIHVRTAIRQFVADAMEPITPGNVYGRVHPLTPGTMPGICVYWDNEVGDPNTVAGATVRPCSIVVEAYVEGVDVDDDLDAIALLIEKSMFEDESVGGQAIGVLYGGAKVETSADSEMQYSKIKQVFSVIYRTKDGEPEHGI